MNPVIKNTLAIILGWFIGSVINVSLIELGYIIFPIEGLDINNMEALSKVYLTLEYKYFIFPFLAHALGTLVGAFTTFLIATKHKIKFALAIGIIFLIGGTVMTFVISSPLWFIITDLLLAYIPMAWIGGKLAQTFIKKN